MLHITIHITSIFIKATQIVFEANTIVSNLQTKYSLDRW